MKAKKRQKKNPSTKTHASNRPGKVNFQNNSQPAFPSRNSISFKEEKKFLNENTSLKLTLEINIPRTILNLHFHQEKLNFRKGEKKILNENTSLKSPQE